MLKVPGSNPTETIDFFVILREQVCSMVNIGEGNLYVTCIKGFGGLWRFKKRHIRHHKK